MRSTAALPEPLAVPWTMKPLSSAATGMDLLDDGRLHLWIRHDVLHGVTPEMLVWWFQHMEGDMEVEGRRHPRYRVWHPRDHVAFRYERRPPSGVIGPGAIFHIVEVLGRNPDWVVDIHTHVRKLDPEGFEHRPHLLRGLVEFARMDYRFERVPGGTRYENSLTVGREGQRWFNQWLRPRAFPDNKGAAWLLHNVEEVGNFEFFLPALYAQEHGRAPVTVALGPVRSEGAATSFARRAES